MLLLIFITSLSTISYCYGQESPKVNPFAPMIKPMIGGKTSFACQSLFGSPPLSISWYKNGIQLTDSSSTRIRTNEDSSMLTIDSIKSSHSGNYTCKISNRFGSDAFTSELLVEGSPNWISQPKDTIKVNYGDSMTVQCSASGYPKPNVSWKRFKDSLWINPIDANIIVEKIEGYNQQTLIIRNATREHNGKYSCTISNGIKPDLWSEFEITIEGNI
ncbi:cell adhesion molecule DSCAM-like isoform X2 [Panonychus citri]|uniref:cell adhesion molecule DSCAM-like isoform X2 n=1 Tax=Panonychus citri TaxID=50023 RepID=UPI00230717AA|nr:cell adhesion molecule DSCAM-like isoform X2 [Panonychus citri]